MTSRIITQYGHEPTRLLGISDRICAISHSCWGIIFLTQLGIGIFPLIIRVVFLLLPLPKPFSYYLSIMPLKD